MAVIGYKYFFTLHMGLCRGTIFSIRDIRVGDRPILDEPLREIQDPSDDAIVIDKPDLFGGEDGEGGVVGNLWPMWGRFDQGVHAQMVSAFGSPQPTYRLTTTVLFDGQISAMNPYPKPWKFRVWGWGMGQVATPPGISAGFAINGIFSDDTLTVMFLANPAWVILETLIDPTFGRGLPLEFIDQGSFMAAGSALQAEGFGLCVRWARRDGIDSFIDNIINHIGATLYQDRVTGLIRLDLMRGDYVVDEVPLFDHELGVCEISEATTVSNGPLINEMKVVYVDPVTGEDRTVVVRNPAPLQIGSVGVNAMTKEYRSLPTAELALRVAQRDLRSQGSHLKRFTIKMNRIGWKVKPGGVIRIQDLSRGILPTVVRIGAIEDGGLGEGGVTLKAVQDVFALPATTFSGNEPPRWQPPNNTPCIGAHKVFELPYTYLARNMAASELEALEPETGFIGTVAERGQALNVGYKIATRPDAPDGDDPPDDEYFCPGYEWP